MIGPSGAVKVMIATKPVDFRKGAEGMAALVKAEMSADPFSGTIYVFRAKRTDRIKLIFWDGSDMCLVAKRLEDGEFHWPRMQDRAMYLTAAQFSALFEGLHSKRVHTPSEMRTPVKAG
ncbi:IS66 family insertion sequence element accessory protein TnpB [Rhizobium laguerreae]|uniref:IS66 family insertion sequence element accessory protein TnpB n=1 Tax=Rhizobium laguerreae TaxID=1076926 RepID=UPI0014793E28|nr:IS66 family insertion sequence element accessory protein TnpB [Rhizobium laguerreae]NNH42065.1 IS66 family insertion sequence element accessory protein TnpB [Rhizobium laguerreae]NNH57275.1 IS66 family insertion sequence element accessory protein TnpB [Rhizobium laguerreae]